MSYQTNPIANRLKIIKGWKTPYFPTKTLNYTRDIVLWFKVYLLLKTYLNLKKIKLLSCEIRISENNSKILYLSINKFWNAKKEKQKRQPLLRKLHSPLLKSKNTSAVFLLYQNLQLLKQTSNLQNNFLKKKVLSKLWLNKPRISSWLNLVDANKLVRNQITKQQVTIQNWKKKQLSFLQKKKYVIKKKKLQSLFWVKKQKKVLAINARLQVEINLLQSKLILLNSQKKSDLIYKTIREIARKIEKKQHLLQKTHKLYKFLWTHNQTLGKKTSFDFNRKILNIRTKNKLNLIWLKIKKNFNSLYRARLIRNELPELVLRINDSLFTRSYPYQWLFLGNNQTLNKLLNLSFFLQKFNFSQLNKQHLFVQSYHLNQSFNKIKNLQEGKKVFFLKEKRGIAFFNNCQKKNFRLTSLIKKNLAQKPKSLWLKNMKLEAIPFEFQIWKLMRWKKKERRRNIHVQDKKITLLVKNTENALRKKIIPFVKEYKNENQSIRKLISSKKKRPDIFKYYQYRLPYRKNYQSNLILITNYRVKYLIQDCIQKHFAVYVEVKFVRPLNQLKNLKFYRLAFPIWKTVLGQKKKQEKNEKLYHKYIYLGRGFKVKTNFGVEEKKDAITLNQIHNKFLPQNLTQAWNFKKTLKVKKNNNLYASFKKKLEKENPYFLSKKSKRQNRTSNSFQQFQKQRHMQNFISTLILFSQTLDPQPLADHLAKILEKTKKHTWILNTVHQMLKSINFNRAVGYRIGFMGRINSADKSKLIYLTRKSVPRQGFAKNINFATSQARARIGAFGIKIWVYY
jgi:hypothetical protein